MTDQPTCTCGLPLGPDGPHADDCATRQGITHVAVLPVTPPTRPGPRDLARLLNLEGVEQLAERIKVAGRSVSRRTLYKWHEMGAPFDSEANLVAWVAHRGTPIAPAQQTIGQAIDGAMAQIAPTNPAGQGDDADKKPAEGMSAAAIKALSSSRLQDRLTYKHDLEIAELEKVLVHRDKVIALVKSLALEMTTGLTDLIPRIMRSLPADVALDQRPQVREALGREITELRQQLHDKAPKLLVQLFGVAD